MRIVITGCSRTNGIGQELARQLLARGNTIEATTRGTPLTLGPALKHDRFRVHVLDVASDESAETLGKSLDGAIDAIINNAGVYDGTGDLLRVTTSDMHRLYDVNALGAFRVTRALLPQLLLGKTKKVLNLSTGMAILGDENDGRAYAYRMSKVALNMMTRTMAANLRSKGVVLSVMDPGWVQTDMGGAGAEVPVEVSARGIIAWLDKMGPAESGELLHYSGRRLPW